jgi:branched-subunit amino acid transport protein
MTTWIVILAVGLGSLAFRVVPQLVFERVTLSERGDQLVRHAGAGAITALIVTSTKQSASGNSTVPTLLAAGIGVVLAARGASMIRILICGGAVYAFSTIAVDLLVR